MRKPQFPKPEDFRVEVKLVEAGPYRGRWTWRVDHATDRSLTSISMSPTEEIARRAAALDVSEKCGGPGHRVVGRDEQESHSARKRGWMGGTREEDDG